MPKINQVSPIPVATKLELKPEINKLEFNSKLEKLSEKKEMSRADFQSLAKNVVGGEKSLATFLKTNNVLPSADVNELSKFFHPGKNANLKATITNSKAITKITDFMKITESKFTVTDFSQLPKSESNSIRNKAYIEGSKSLVKDLETKIKDFKGKIESDKNLLQNPNLSPEKKEEIKTNIQTKIKKLQKSDISEVSRVEIQAHIANDKEKLENPNLSATEKRELKNSINTDKFTLENLEQKLKSAKAGSKAGITKESIGGYQASKAGDNLYQKVLATKETSGGATTTLLNKDDLGILPSFKPKIKAEGADWAKVKIGFMDGKEGVSMREMTLYRKAYVDQLAKEVAEANGVEINLNSFGSANLTSDYDATISVKSNKDGSEVDPKTEAKVLKEFNSKFRAEWKVEAGTAFDTNVYLKDFDMENKESPTYDGRLKSGEKLQDKYESGQNTLALVKQRIHMDQGSWDIYKNKMISGLPEASKPEARKQYDTANEYALSREKHLNIEIIKINNPAFPRDGASDKALKSEVDRIKSHLGVHAGDIEAQASNRLYEKKLAVVQTKIEAGNSIDKKITALEAKVESKKASPRDISELSSLRIAKQDNEIDTKMLKGKALFFANEPYFSEGTVRHVVGNLQRFKDEPDKQYEIPKLAALQSLNENTGDAMKDFNHYMKPNVIAGTDDGNLGKVMFKTSKYVERLCDSLEVTLGGKTKDIPASAKITLNGTDYPLKAVVADLKSSLKEPLAIRGETREKGSTDEKKSSEAISLFKGSAKLDVFKNVANAGEYKQLLLDITSKANVLARQ